jgi:hypothetical protein
VPMHVEVRMGRRPHPPVFSFLRTSYSRGVVTPTCPWYFPLRSA